MLSLTRAGLPVITVIIVIFVKFVKQNAQNVKIFLLSGDYLFDKLIIFVVVYGYDELAIQYDSITQRSRVVRTSLARFVAYSRGRIFEG